MEPRERTQTMGTVKGKCQGRKDIGRDTKKALGRGRAINSYKRQTRVGGLWSMCC